MKRNPSIPLKAIFLLTAFLLNTVVGCACAVGMEDNHDHANHETKDTPKTHQHQHHSDHNHSKSGHHHESEDHHAAKKDKDNCCKDEVVKLLKADKVSPLPSSVITQPIIFSALLPTFYQFDALASFVHIPSTKYFVRSYHPPIPDIRISIQSFQI